MRIALVITELDPGGAERCLTELAIFLSQRGHQVLVLTLGPLPAHPYAELTGRLTAADIEVRSANAGGASSGWRALRWLRKELDAFAPDVVQAMLWHANVLSALALRRRSPILLGGMRVSEPRRWRWSVERWAARRMARMVCVSEDVRTHALAKERIAAEKLVVIPNGVPFEPSQTGPSSTEPGHTSEPCEWSSVGVQRAERVLLFVGRLEAQKGALQLVEHARELLAGLTAWSLVLIGRGSLQPQIAALIDRSALTHQVHLAGWQARADRWIAASDVVVLPAQYEGMPNVLLEAMATGKPFVAFSVDGIAQLLAEDYPSKLAEAQLAAPGDWPAFIARVRTLAADSDLRRACGQANHTQVVHHFRLEDQLARYEALYQALINSRDTASAESHSPPRSLRTR